jgi:hypothetical protein
MEKWDTLSAGTVLRGEVRARKVPMRTEVFCNGRKGKRRDVRRGRGGRGAVRLVIPHHAPSGSPHFLAPRTPAQAAVTTTGFFWGWAELWWFVIVGDKTWPYRQPPPFQRPRGSSYNI